MALTIGLQFLCYLADSQGFTPELFGSIGDGQQSLLYTSYILLFPIFSLLLKFKDENEVVFSTKEIFAYISYGALASYTIAFVGSPQHYAGFLQMACLSIFLIVKSSKNTIHQVLLMTTLSIFPAIQYSYIHATSSFDISKSSYYDYTGKLGTSLYFRTPSNFDIITDEFNSLITKQALNKKVYFLSKDKLFIENYLGKNIEPKTYDVFVNYVKLSPSDTAEILSKEKVDFIVLDSEIHRKNIKQFINLEKGNMSKGEFQHHSRILSNIDLFAESIKSNLVECSDRYCIYKIAQ